MIRLLIYWIKRYNNKILVIFGEKDLSSKTLVQISILAIKLLISIKK